MDRNEILRYLGAENMVPELEEMIVRGEWLVREASRPRHISRRVLLTVEESSVVIGETKLPSRTLADHLQGCGEAFLFACTLGAGVDTLIKRYTVTEMPMVPVLQACAAAYTEEYADRAQKELERYAQEHSLYLRPRYSPGYGDFPLEAQKFFFNALEISKRIGVSLTDGCLMVPFKSITAVVGLSPDPSLCHVGKCMSCTARNCPFRKES